jgi:hypothetical protein
MNIQEVNYEYSRSKLWIFKKPQFGGQTIQMYAINDVT